MEFKIILDKKEIGTLECSTIPGPSHSFELNKKRYKILKLDESKIIVEEMVLENLKPKKSQEPQVKD